MGGRHYYFAKELAKLGHNVHLIAASYTHLLREPPNTKKNFEIHEQDGFKMVWIKMPNYNGAHDKKRILNWFLFTWKLLKLPKIILDKPDVILASSPSPFIALSAYRLSKQLEAKFIFEERDIWPLTLIDVGGFSPKHPFIRLMQWVEDFAYKNADTIISNLPGLNDHILERGVKDADFHWIANGIDLEEIENKEPLEPEIINQIPKDKFIVGYVGTIGLANSLDTLIEAAKILKNDDSIYFVIVGKGQEKNNLEKLVKEYELKNVVFIDAIRKTQVQSMLKNFDACYIGWKNKPLYRYGIAAQKIPEYIISGKPIIHSYSGNYDPVIYSKSGVSVFAEKPLPLSKVISNLKRSTTIERNTFGLNSKYYANKICYKKLISSFTSLLSH